MIRLYGNTYKSILKTDIMLLVIALALIFFTFGFWAGVPVFIVSKWFFELNTPWYVQYMGVTLSVGMSLSLFFIPINLKVAKTIAEMKCQSTLGRFIKIQLSFVLVIAFVFVIVCGVFILIAALK